MENIIGAKRYVLLEMLFAAILVAILFGCGERTKARNSDSGKGFGKNVMEKATGKGILKLPDFSLQDLNGQEHRLADYVGEKPVLLVFWTTGCRFCIAEIPRLNKIFLERSEDLTFLSVNIVESQRTVTRLVKAKGIQYPVLMDPHGVTMRDYSIRGVPTIVVIDTNGSMGYYGHDLSEAMRKVEGLLS